jgi:lyso-ornithine lipid O-acyltransferase
MPMHSSPLRACVRLTVYLTLTLLLMPVQAVAVALGLRFADWLPRAYHRICCSILSVRVRVLGQPVEAAPVLFASNHCSYLDVMVLSSILPVSFIAKTEVAGWPLFGQLAKLQRTVFVRRERAASRDQRDEVARRLAAGGRLVLFPEGTSSDGSRVLGFKSALFSVAEARTAGKPLPVQPVSIAYAGLDGMPLGRCFRPLFTWYGDMELVGHLWTMAGIGLLEAVVEFHPVVSIESFANRKALAIHCQGKVAQGVAAALSGRPNAAVAAMRSNSAPVQAAVPAVAAAGSAERAA